MPTNEKVSAKATITSLADADMFYVVQSGTPNLSKKISWSSIKTALKTYFDTVYVGQPQGRLTLESGVPVSTTDQADKVTLYYTPYVGNKISLYDGVSAWSTVTFAELSLDISAYTASKPYDIWIYNNAGTATLDSTVWTNATTRATA